VTFFFNDKPIFGKKFLKRLMRGCHEIKSPDDRAAGMKFDSSPADEDRARIAFAFYLVADLCEEGKRFNELGSKYAHSPYPMKRLA